MFQWAGIDFGEENICILQKSLKRLAILSGAVTLKFFGKIYGVEKDYWVAQGELDFQEERQTKESTLEARGTGVNKTVFWVTDNLFMDWIQLPDAIPE